VPVKFWMYNQQTRSTVIGTSTTCGSPERDLCITMP